jgi:hypothetical protein
VSIGRNKQLYAIGNPELAEYRGEVVSNGCLADKQTDSDFFALETFADQHDNLTLPVGEGADFFLLSVGFRPFPRTRHIREHVSHQRGIKPSFARVDVFDR